MRRFLVVLSLCFFGSNLFADVPHDAPTRFKDPKYWNRCGSTQGEPDISDEDCKGGTWESFHKGCITESERNYFLRTGVVVTCIRKTPVSVCPCSCFEEKTEILVDLDGVSTRKIIDFHADASIVSLAEESSVNNLLLQEGKVSYKTDGPEKKDPYVFETTAGSLGVSETHAILLSDGRVVAAKDVRTKDSLVTLQGKAPLKSIKRMPASSGIVHNLLVRTENKKGHLIVANEHVVGDLLWQNSLGTELNSVLLRQ